MRSFRLLAVAVLAVVLALSSAQNAFAATELAYDDGNLADNDNAVFAGVRFSLPTGVTSARLLYVRFAWGGPVANAVNVIITGPDHQTLVAPTILLPMSGTGAGCPAGWLVGGYLCSGVDVSGLGIVVTGDFYVILQRIVDLPLVTRDDANSGHSFEGGNLAGLTTVSLGDWLTRVDIDPIAPVGGIVTPVDTFAILGPWLAVIGLVGCIGTIVVLAKKRRQ